VIGITQAVCQEPEVTDRLKAYEQLGMSPIGGGSWMMQLKAARGAPRLLVETSSTLVG
jgi:hypothetical protein